MASPTVMVEAAFPLGASNVNNLVLDDVARGKLDTAQLGGDLNWIDLSTFLRSAQLSRGATRLDGPVITYEAGRSTAVLDNSDRRFERTNLAGPYVAGGVSQVVPMVAVRYRATWAGVTYQLWRGFADGWPLSYPAPGDSVATLLATDAFKVFEANDRKAVTAVGAGELAGARVNRILNSAGWEATARIVDIGDTTLQATTLSGSVLAELQLVSDTELGELYMDGAGRVRFRHRHAILQDTRSAVSQATVSDAPVNSLVGDNSTFEAGLGNWLNSSNSTPTQSTAQAHTGTGSMRLASVAAGDMEAKHTSDATLTTNGFLAIPGVTYTIGAWFRADATASPRSCQVRVSWYDTGAVNLLATDTGSSVTDSTSAWTQSTGVFVAPAGAAIARVRVRVQATGGASELHYVDDVSFTGNELGFTDVTTGNDDSQLVNRARITRVGGVEQQADNAASQNAYLVHADSRTDLLMQTDTAAFDYAGWLVFYGKDPEQRIDQLVINPNLDPDKLFPQVLGRELGDRITIVLHPPGGGSAVTQDVFIRGIQHELIPGAQWLTTWSLQAASKYSFLILDNAVLGKLDSNALSF